MDCNRKSSGRIETGPWLMEHITSQLNDKSLWLEKMESCFLQEYSTSEKLMDYYYRNDKQQFDAKAPLLAEHFEDWCTDFLINKVEKGTPLHVSLLKRKIKFTGDSSYFAELKSYVDENELKAFMETIGSSDIQAKLYSSEKMYDELENLIRKEQRGNSYYARFDFEFAIESLLNVRPVVAWSLFEQRYNEKWISPIANSDREIRIDRWRSCYIRHCRFRVIRKK
jgi:hypothetical protein